MLLTYFDEVKPEPQGQTYYWLGGLMVFPEVVPALEAELNAIARECFGNDAPTPETEFHATRICSGSKNFKSWRNPKERFEVLKRLLKVIDQPDGVFRVVVRLEVAKIDESWDTEALALMYLIERVNTFAKLKKTHALLIGDLDNEKAVNRAVRNLAEYRTQGTKYAYGRKIENVIDTVHFAHSHHSRMLQLADTYLWTKQLEHRTDQLSEHRQDLVNFIRKETDISWPHKYKYWPPERLHG